MLHTWRHVDFNQPRVEVLINHEIIPYKFTVALSSINEALAASDCPYDNILNFLQNLIPIVLSNKGNKLTFFPHAFINNKIFIVLLNRVVGKVLKSVVDVVKGVIVCTKSHIAFIIEPYFGRVVVLNEDPLSDVKLLSSN